MRFRDVQGIELRAPAFGSRVKGLACQQLRGSLSSEAQRVFGV